MNRRQVWVVLEHDAPWQDRAFPTMQAACAAVETAEGVYWPQLLLRGFRIAPAVTEWETVSPALVEALTIDASNRCANPRCGRPHAHSVFRMIAGVPTWFCCYRCCQDMTDEPDRVGRCPQPTN